MNLYIMPHTQNLTSDSKTCTKENIDYNISNEIGLTAFGFSMKKL
jgi:hypothetical protein